MIELFGGEAAHEFNHSRQSVAGVATFGFGGGGRAIDRGNCRGWHQTHLLICELDL